MRLRGDYGRRFPFHPSAGDGDEPAEERELATVGEIYELWLREYHVTPIQLNTEWTEEQLALMLEKRKQYHERLAEEIDKQRGAHGEGRDVEEKPRRVSNAEMFSNIHSMQKKGGAGNVPLTG